jgi:hypothetical protein
MSEHAHPLFDRKIRAPLRGRDAIAASLDHSERMISELLGVFIYNARHANGEDSLFENPIVIDRFDQSRLADMDLVETVSRSAAEGKSEAVAKLTKYGSFIVSRLDLLIDTDELNDIPLVDPKAVKQLLVNSFVG